MGVRPRPGVEDAKAVYVATLYDEDGNHLESLGGIADPDRAYTRVVEAELADQALSGR